MASLDLRRQKIYRDTTIPLDGQSGNDTGQISTPSSKRKQVSLQNIKFLTLVIKVSFRLWLDFVQPQDVS